MYQSVNQIYLPNATQRSLYIRASPLALYVVVAVDYIVKWRLYSIFFVLSAVILCASEQVR